MKVLFVDDDPDALESAAMALRKEPYEILRARSAEEALAVLGRTPIDAVVSDEQMPGMKGGEFLAVVRWKHPEVTRILLTGRATLDAALRAINEGQIYRLLEKPFRTSELATVIREALGIRMMTAATAKIWHGAREQHGALSWYDDQREAFGPSPNAPTLEQTDRAARALYDSGNVGRAPKPRTGDSPSVSERIGAGIARLLSTREQDVLMALAAGLSAKEVADQLGISPHTARNHTKAVYRKLGLHSRGELFAWLSEHLVGSPSKATR
jgi:DNA-binding NarL/FixJ family response regulator